MGEPIVVPSRRGTPIPRSEPPPHVPVTGEQQWQLFNPAVQTPSEIGARDHRFRLINGAGSTRLYLALALDGALALRLTPNPPSPGSGVHWQTELELPAFTRGGEPLQYGQSFYLSASVWSQSQESHGILTVHGSEGPYVGEIRDRTMTYQLHLPASRSLREPEWQVRGQPSGTRLRSSEWFSLYNKWVGDSIVLDLTGPQPSLQTTRRSTPSQHTFSLRLQPNVPWQGVISWYGRFPLMGPASPGSCLTGVRVPVMHTFPVALTFWSRTRRKFDVVVPEGSDLSAAQMVDVFGSATPPLPVEMWLLVQAAQIIDVNSIWVNLDYLD